jgi:cytoskeleton protein RodZ
MSDAGDATVARPALSAGGMLRAARQAQGLHIAALAAALKVTPRKLEALEADRYGDLQGATFVRALAQAACRALKIDPAPVLAELPEQDRGTLSQMGGGLNEPFREHGARRDSADLPSGSSAVVVAVALLLIGALAFWLLPADWSLPSWASGRASVVGDASPTGAPAAPAAWGNGDLVSAPVAGAMAASAAVPVAAVASASLGGALAVAEPASAATNTLLLQLKARSPSWVEVVDGRAQVLMARTLSAGEVVGVDGVLPLRVKIGNAAATEMSFRGLPVDLAPAVRDNVARLELK